LFVADVLATTGVAEVVADVGVGNEASAAVARAAGFDEVTPGRWLLRYDRRRP
jgi:RimJ/RimL family protein N-acetyltransferase